jgi:hypothetical protein
VDWLHTVFDDRGGGNNHSFFSILSRLSLGAWRALTGAAPEAFSEAAARVPSLVAGLGTVVVVGCFLRGAGFPVAGVAAAWLLALHPWHVRYSSEARGYALLLFFLVLATWAMVSALGKGRWRDWLLFGGLEFGALYSWNGGVYPLAMLNGAAALALLFSRRATVVGLAPGGAAPGGALLPAGPSNRVSALARLVLANLAAAAVFLPLYAPRHPQVVHFLARTVGMDGGMPDGAWWGELAGHLLAGTQMVARFPMLPVDYSVESAMGGRAWAGWLAFAVAVAVWGLGLAYALRRAKWFAFLVFSPVYGAVLGVLHFAFGLHARVLVWYVIYLIVPLVIGWGLAAEAVAAWVSRGQRWPVVRCPAAVFVVALGVAAFGVLVARPLRWTSSHPVEDLRGAFLATRGRHEPLWHTGPSSVRTVYLWRHAKIYEPRAETHARDAPALRRCMEGARAAGHELYVVIGNLMWVATDEADFYALVEDPAEFEPVAQFWAAHPTISLKAYRMRRAPLVAPGPELSDAP